MGIGVSYWHGPESRALPKAEPHHQRARSRCIVIEAAKRSGSLITARYALEQGRELFAMPGSTFNPMTAGCHGLIREGAKLVERADQVLDELAPLLRPHAIAAKRLPEP